MMSTLHGLGQHSGEITVFAKGAPDILLEHCTHEFSAGIARPLTPQRRREILGLNEQLTSSALRTLGVATRFITQIEVTANPTTINEQATEQHLTFLGLVGMMDPPRPEVFHAVEQAKQAGIRPIFGPHHGYASSNVTEEILSEFRDMVEAFHAADIEVILDVVYNHTAEGDEAGPIYSFKGIDNSTYYLLESDWRHYCDDTGTGNTLNCANRYVRKMIVDSLKFWVNEMHVDGFRFDLASIFTRKSARPE